MVKWRRRCAFVVMLAAIELLVIGFLFALLVAPRAPLDGSGHQGCCGPHAGLADPAQQQAHFLWLARGERDASAIRDFHEPDIGTHPKAITNVGIHNFSGATEHIGLGAVTGIDVSHGLAAIRIVPLGIDYRIRSVSGRHEAIPARQRRINNLIDCASLHLDCPFSFSRFHSSQNDRRSLCGYTASTPRAAGA
jgi:hypothetical protein